MDTALILKNHKEEVREYVRKSRKDKGVSRAAYKSILPTKYRSYVYRANKKGLSFNMPLDLFNSIISSVCVYCGSESGISVDRINSHGGYTEDNIQPCCYSCNIMKTMLDANEFVSRITKIHNHLKSKGLI